MNSQILIIEDEPAIMDTISCSLRLENYDSIGFSTGIDGLNYLESHEVHLIILDIGLPDQSGFEICKKIRKISQVPIIFLTARDSEIDKIVGLEIGADDYLTKPFSPRELLARIKAIFRRMNGSIVPNSQSSFVVDEKKKQIFLNHQLMDLTRYEFLLLKHLIQFPGQVFSRDQLMERIWDDPGSSLDRTIDAHIKSIRSKCKKINSIDPIITHRGMGYSLKED